MVFAVFGFLRTQQSVENLLDHFGTKLLDQIGDLIVSASVVDGCCGGRSRFVYSFVEQLGTDPRALY